MPSDNSAAFRVTLDSNQWKEVEKAMKRLGEPFTKPEKVSVGTAGSSPVVDATRRILKRRPATAPTIVFTRGGVARFAHIPGNLAKSARRTPQKYVSRSYFAWIGIAMKGVKAGSEYTISKGPGKGISVPLYGQGILSSYAPYGYKAYGDASGSSYSNWQNLVLSPAITVSLGESTQLMTRRFFEIFDKKVKNAGFF